MSSKNLIEFPSKGIWRSIKGARDRTIRHVEITTRDNIKVVDSPVGLDLRIIPRVFTAPLQAIGLVTSIFAKMTNNKISMQLENDEE